ncbi:response regulator [Tuwongella immobilis]|uniref:Response regulatory domain-containing protein n=1 Tax=Tuwongella immobilis TaxID=692036 RepID=A0A6C2YVG9_9BACT|nr:response regulator [Tuwongella immobilis]VIP04979.1 dna-binding response regulator : DNA-binding response regulator OS=Chondromyces apiculatus DSM 436 GN=CAP_5016 PE=4 SV=1: Response_reg: HTH_3 [Tuwongella immobilis]VTS07316.1 dna-binding response regulator : DNA-binding response regulator OS=Chondromyces apiculatus DSM 436 GN=CAP_5016 PE=4 SV=1: Response_reg: HTH_3 [Tuwongella immobilis]
MSWNLDPVSTPPGGVKANRGKPTPGVLGELQAAGEINILILDDDVATCSLIQAALTNKDFTIEMISDPTQVEECLKLQGRYQLILLDYVLPGLEADQVFGWIRDYQPDASIIVITGYPSVDSALSCLRNRTYDYLTKPFQIDQLREIVLRCLKNKGLLRMTDAALREALGTAIRNRRKGLNLTLQELSAKTEVSLGYLSQIELGKNSASIETLYRISLALGVRMGDLFSTIQRG